MNLIVLVFIEVETTLVASKVYMNPEYSLHSDKPQKNEIHSLISTCCRKACHVILIHDGERQSKIIFAYA